MSYMLKDSFLKYLSLERNYSEDTICSYSVDLEQFEAFLKGVDEHLDFCTVDAEVIRSWVISLMDNNYKASSVNRKLSTLRSFYHYLLRINKVEVDPTIKVVAPKKGKVLPVFVKEADMDRLLDEVDFGRTFKGIRDRMIIEMFYSTGVRCSELVQLDDCDIDFLAKQIKVTGKRNKQRLIPFGREMLMDMKSYLSERYECCPGSCGAFFVNEKGKRLSCATVGLIVKRNLSKVVTLKKRSPHVLRHSFATSMLNNEAELESVKELLGHASLAATEIYTHTTFEELKKVYELAHPRA